MSLAGVDPDIVTPVKGLGVVARITGGQRVPYFFSKVAAGVARRSGSPLRIGGTVLAVRHAHVAEALVRDEDYGLAIINAEKIDEVNGGPFILGMDRSVVLERERRALYTSLEAVDTAALETALKAEIDATLAQVRAGGRIDAVGGYARPLAAHTAKRLFGVVPPSDDFLMEVSRSVFRHTFLNQGNNPKVRERAIKAGAYMGQWLGDEIARRRASGDLGDDMMGALLKQSVLDDEGTRRTLGGMLVGSIDTTASCIAKILTVVSRDDKLARMMLADVDDTQRMYHWCWEALRRWPHNPVVLRKAIANSSLAGRAINTGDAVIVFTQAAMLDKSIFPEPGRMRPDREIHQYFHMGGGLHPCSGRPVNRFQIPLLIAGLMRRGIAKTGGIKWAGPFPHRLTVTLEKAP